MKLELETKSHADAGEVYFSSLGYKVKRKGKTIDVECSKEDEPKVESLYKKFVIDVLCGIG